MCEQYKQDGDRGMRQFTTVPVVERVRPREDVMREALETISKVKLHNWTDTARVAEFRQIAADALAAVAKMG